MKKIRYSRRLLAASTLIAGLGVVAIGAGTALAAPSSFEQGPFPGLVEAIAERFNVSETDVQQVIDDQMEQTRAQHETEQQDRLAQAIADGKLTQEQADAIAAKHEEDKAFFESLSSLDKSERHDAVQTHMEETKAWAEDNGIKPPLDHIMGPRGGHHKGPHGDFGHAEFESNGDLEQSDDAGETQP